MNPTNPNADFELSAAREAAQSLRIDLHVLNASNENELEAAFASTSETHVSALIGASDTFLFGRRDKVAALAAHYRIPAIYYLRQFAQAGGLMTYGNDLTDPYRLVGIYVGRILKGEKPADLPVMEPTKFEFVINLKTARALGLSVPQSLLVAADEVIE
jgi:putative ABC transport system substrate-binding protein